MADLAEDRMAAAAPTPDAELADRVGAGDADALAELYDRYSRLVFSMGYSILKDYAAAEDVTQEVFAALWTRAGAFRPDRGVFRHWFLHLAHNRVIDELRKRRRFQQNAADQAPEDAALALVSPADTADEAVTNVLYGAAREALDALPEEQRAAIVMAYLDGWTQSEIAERTGAPLGTVKTRQRLGLGKLREMLSQPPANARWGASRTSPWTP